MFETRNAQMSRPKRRGPPNLYMQYRLLHSFWGPRDGPSREFTKTALQMAMNASYRTFLINFEFAVDNDLIRLRETKWSRTYAITSKGVTVHNELEILFSLLFDRRPEIETGAVAANCEIQPIDVEIKAENRVENQLTWIR